MQVQLYSDANKGRSVATRWGRVPFDAAGYATLEVKDEDVGMLRALGWLVEPPAPPPAEVQVKEAEESAPEPKPEECKHVFTKADICDLCGKTGMMIAAEGGQVPSFQQPTAPGLKLGAPKRRHK